MKKIMMLLVAALTLSTVATAQKVDVEGTKKKVAASDADIQNPKKSDKAATWINRGNVYYAAETAPTKDVFIGMDEMQLNLIIGKPSQTRAEEVGGTAYEVWVYPHIDLYLPQADKRVAFWKQKTNIVDNGLDVAFEAYEKAVELDPKQQSKVKVSAEKVLDLQRQNAEILFGTSDYKGASAAFAKAFDYSESALINNPDTLVAYNAGYVSVLAENYDEALKYLNKSIEYNYYGGNPEGDVYFLLYHAYTGKNEPEKAEAALKEGVQKFPANSKLIETLIYHYTTTGQDASQIIPVVEDALQGDPNNFVFHFGLGLIYDKLDDYDKAAASFERAAELNPEDFSSIFNLAITYIRQADAMLDDLNAIPVNEKARYEEKLAEFNSYYKKSLPLLERSHELNPSEIAAVELLKNIYFRFRDETPEMMQNFEKYNEIYKSMMRQ